MLTMILGQENGSPDKYFYFGYSISFDVRGTFSLTNGGFGKNKTIRFHTDMSSSVYVDHKKCHINSW